MNGNDASVIVTYNLLHPAAAKLWSALLPRTQAPLPPPVDGNDDGDDMKMLPGKANTDGVEESKGDTSAGNVVTACSESERDGDGEGEGDGDGDAEVAKAGAEAEAEEAAIAAAMDAAASGLQVGAGLAAAASGKCGSDGNAGASQGPKGVQEIVGETEEHVALRKMLNETVLADMCADVLCVQGWNSASSLELPGYKHRLTRGLNLSARIFVRKDMSDALLTAKVLVGDDACVVGGTLPPCVAVSIETASIVIVNVHLPYDAGEEALSPAAAAARKKTRNAGLQTALNFATVKAKGSHGSPKPVVFIVSADDATELTAPRFVELLKHFKFVVANGSQAWRQNALSADGKAVVQATAVYVREGFGAAAPAAGAASFSVPKTSQASSDYVHITPLGAPQNPWTTSAMLGSTHVPLIIEPTAFYAPYK